MPTPFKCEISPFGRNDRNNNSTIRTQPVCGNDAKHDVKLLWLYSTASFILMEKIKMDLTITFLILFTFIIHLVGTLAYSLRISGTRTGTIALSFALFNIMILGSRTANTFQGPLLAKRIEQAYFRRSIIWLGASRMAGTLLAQLILIPAAMLIVSVAEKI